ncbi:hypothetical protein ABGB12_02665 [Actinocorallia sp. B10E7]|uniref:hypothetical protein n=1 Tax=Actinocorallia sp. B10E7 TaxID=3153558 RepID=UPI00325D58F9
MGAGRAGRMKRIVDWSLGYADVLVALTLAIVVSVLGILGDTSPEVMQNATMATLAVVTFVLLRDRLRGDGSAASVQRSVQEMALRLEQLSDGLQRRSDVRVVPGAECNRILAETRRNAIRWVFKGSTGAYVRAVTLPECVDRARRFRRPVTFRLEILDPMDESLCARFVGLHQRLATRPDSPERSWTVDGTRRELFATVLAACWYQQKYDLLDIDIRLSSSFSIFRYELSTDRLIITQRGPEFPAVIVDGGTPTFDCWESELQISLQQARRIPIQAVRDQRLGDPPDVEEIRSIFRALGMELPPGYGDEDVIDLRELALNSSDPYGQSTSWD